MTTNTTIGSNGTTISKTLLDTMNGASSSSSSTTASKTGAQSASDLQNTFLTLLVTQLKNQDPTNPADSSQMTSQLAQINTVTGIGQLNASLASLSSQLSAGQSTQAAFLIGSNVLSAGNDVTVSKGAATPFGVQLANDVSDLQLVVKNSAGQIVNTLDLGAQPAGVVPIYSWTPVDANGKTLPDGSYTITAQGTINGEAATAPTLSAAQVVSVVQQPDGTPGLKLSNGKTVGLPGVASILPTISSS